MKIVVITLGMLMLATSGTEPRTPAHCKISQSIYRDADGKGFELVFGEPIPETASSKATAKINHSQVGQLYKFNVSQSSGYGSIYLRLSDYEGTLEPRDFGINFFAQSFVLATPLWFGEETQAPKYAFIAGLGGHDYYRRKEDF